jgi:hypothetical protein
MCLEWFKQVHCMNVYNMCLKMHQFVAIFLCEHCVCMHACMHVCIFKNLLMYVCLSVGEFVYACMSIFMCVCNCVCMFSEFKIPIMASCACIYTCIHAYMDRHHQLLLPNHTYPYTHTYIHTYIYPYTHTHIHTHMYIPAWRRLLGS